MKIYKIFICLFFIILLSFSPVLADDENFEYPEYTPNFIKLAESYGAVGIRVEKKEDIEPAFRAALENKHRPTIIEFMIDPEDLVYPMIKPGGTLEELIMDC